MPTLRDIAERADVPVDGVVRVLMGQPVNTDVVGRVRQAIDELGSPHSGIAEALGDPGPPGSAAVVAGEAQGEAVAPHVEPLPESEREQLLERFAQVASALEAAVPEGVSSIVYEALRVEVAPVAQRVGQMGTLVDELTRVIRDLGQDVGAERRERLEDLKLLTELIVIGWRNVDRRLGRLEKLVERIEPAGRPRADLSAGLPHRR